MAMYQEKKVSEMSPEEIREYARARGEKVDMDYSSDRIHRFKCYSCQADDVITKIFTSPDPPGKRIAHYLCYRCSYTEARYAGWQLLTTEVRWVPTDPPPVPNFVPGEDVYAVPTPFHLNPNNTLQRGALE